MSIKLKQFSNLFFALLMLSIYSCTNSGQQSSTDSTTKVESKVDAAYTSVMAVHDEVMPEMGTIHRLRKKVGEKIFAGVPKKENKEKLERMVEKLDAADEGMMAWMADFKMPKEKSEAEQLAYLKSEQAKIDKVSKDMFETIEAAKKLLAEYEE